MFHVSHVATINSASRKYTAARETDLTAVKRKKKVLTNVSKSLLLCALKLRLYSRMNIAGIWLVGF